MNIAKALGYMTEAHAKSQGFTHYGSYYGIPLWMANIHTETPEVICKWAPMWWLMEPAMYIEGFLGDLFFPDDEPGFNMVIKGEIDA